MAVPAKSLAATAETRTEILHPPDVWFPAETREIVVRAERYHFVMSLLLLGDDIRFWRPDAEDVEDVFDRLKRSQILTA